MFFPNTLSPTEDFACLRLDVVIPPFVSFVPSCLKRNVKKHVNANGSATGNLPAPHDLLLIRQSRWCKTQELCTTNWGPAESAQNPMAANLRKRHSLATPKGRHPAGFSRQPDIVASGGAAARHRIRQTMPAPASMAQGRQRRPVRRRHPTTRQNAKPTSCSQAGR